MVWLRKVLGIKTDREIIVEIAHEPKVKEARKHLKRADRLLAELQALEGEK